MWEIEIHTLGDVNYIIAVIYRSLALCDSFSLLILQVSHITASFFLIPFIPEWQSF